ncbi:MAG: parvulin peptidyl-prolyl isomerase, partial [Coriobacteriaceae bacterium]|nr:parvulin peptidyl-prolyl isomerase [Coriobacteriaceae bacterium]
QKVLDELNNGADFAELAKEYSTDSGSAQNGGDVGWSGLNSFVDAYSDALDKLKEGETSGLVTSEYGIHIIRCTDIWNAPDEIKKLSDAPDELVDVVRTQMADPAAEQAAYSKYIEDLREKADIHVNDMPSDVPYNVDLSKYISSSSDDEAGEGEDDSDATDEDAEAEGEDGEAIELEADDAADGDVEVELEEADDAADDSSESSSN